MDSKLLLFSLTLLIATQANALAPGGLPNLPNLPGGVEAGRVGQNIQQISNSINQIQQPLPLNQVIGQTIWAAGTVVAVSPGNIKRDLKRRSPVYTLDTVMTDNSGTGELAFTDGTLLSLRKETTIILSQYRHGGGVSPSKDSYVVEVIKGGFRTVTGIISKNNPEGYQIKTPVGTIGVRGTVYDVNYNPGKTELAVAVTSGSINITPTQGAPVVLTQGTPNFAAVVSAKGAQIVTALPPSLRGSLKIIPGMVNMPTTNNGKNRIEVSPCP